MDEIQMYIVNQLFSDTPLGVIPNKKNFRYNYCSRYWFCKDLGYTYNAICNAFY